ncbi:MFS transporter, partial [Vibrio sinaloensis]
MIFKIISGYFSSLSVCHSITLTFQEYLSMSGVKSSQFQLVVIGLVAALMGVGQNGLLVSLPFLVEQSAFSLS